MTTTETKRSQDGHPKTSKVETLGSDPKVIDARDYTERESVFQTKATLLVEEVF